MRITHRNQHHTGFSAALDVSPVQLRRCLRPSGNLAVLRLLAYQRQFDIENLLRAEDLLHDILLQEPENVDELLACIVQPAPPAECDLADFPHLLSDANRVREVLANALQQGACGVNALLYGRPGTGKTQFALAVAATAGLTAVMVRTAEQDGDGLSRRGVWALTNWRNDCCAAGAIV